MILGNRSLDDVSFDDIRNLVDERVPEGLHLDYKRIAYDHNKRFEMLRDISAFANSEGGYLILGVDEDGNGNPTTFVPIDNPAMVVDKMRKLCLDGISERIEGLEVRYYEMGFNQGVVVTHIPPSQRRPHMVTLDDRNEFCRRYESMKRNMTIAEIRDSILFNPLFQRRTEAETAVEPVARESIQPATPIPEIPEQVMTGSFEPMVLGGEVSAGEKEGPIPVQILTQRPVEKFLQRYLMGGTVAQVLILLTPYISTMENSVYNLASVIERVNDDRTRLYVITQPPRENYQSASIEMLKACRNAEIRYNANVHAKLFICWSRDESESFGLFGSGNLTEGGLRYNIELGMMILARSYGKKLLRELYQWSSSTVRSSSQRVKAITP